MKRLGHRKSTEMDDLELLRDIIDSEGNHKFRCNSGLCSLLPSSSYSKRNGIEQLPAFRETRHPESVLFFPQLLCCQET